MRARVCLMIVAFVVSNALIGCAQPSPTAAPTKPSAPAPSGATAVPVDPKPTAAQGAASSAPTAAATAAPKTTAGTSTPAAKLKRGGTLIAVYPEPVDSLDMQLKNQSSHPTLMLLYDTLLGFQMADPKTEKFEVGPALAESFKVVDPMTLEFKLVKGAKFHDGTDVNAAAAKASFERAMNHPKSQQKSDLASIQEVKTVDDYTMRFNLKTPNAVLPIQLTPAASRAIGLVSKAAVDKVGDDQFASNPVGSGPFRLKQWLKDDRIILEKFPGHWQKGLDGQPLPYLDGITERHVPDSAAALLELRSGNVHVNFRLDLNYAATVQGQPELVIQKVPAISRVYPGIWINNRPGQTAPISTNQKLRWAAQHAIDKEGLNKAIGFGMGTPAYHPYFWAGQVGFDDSLPKRQFDLAKAQSLMAEAGLPNGADVEVKAINRPADVRPLEAIQSMWAKANIRLIINQMDRLAWINDGAAGKFELLSHSWERPVDHQVVLPYKSGSPGNWGGYSNPEIDKLYDQAGREYDSTKRAEIYKQMQRILYDEAYQVVGVDLPILAAINKKVQNFTTAFAYRYVWME